MKQRKIAIIGAGSAQFSGGIIRDLCVTPNLYGTKLTLMDVDEQRLHFITEMGKKLAKELNGELIFESTTDRAAALDGADYVINTAQDGGHSWASAMMEMGREAELPNGCIPMVYQMLFLLDVSHDIEKYCPNALQIQSANPVFEGGTAIHRLTKARTIGLCHGHYGYREIADVLGLDRKDVTARMYGFNHWIWMTDFRYKGQNAYPMIDKWIEEKAEEYWSHDDRKYSDQQMSRAAIHQYHMFGLMPIGDTPRMMDFPNMIGWLYNENLDVKKYWYSKQGGFDSAEGWTQYLEDLNQNLRNIERVATHPEARVSEVFEPVQSDEQIVPIIESLECDIKRVFQVNIANEGQLVEGFPEDIVVECEGVISGAGINGVHMGRLPERVMATAMNPRFAQCELLNQAVKGDREALRVSLLMNHGAKSLKQVDTLIDKWLTDPRNKYADVFQS
ncbi:MAG: hypothetical protein PHI98_02785 [Eubacteriales bacterium]|nr:hypothetical protein [Eubacteriales bacterium]